MSNFIIKAYLFNGLVLFKSSISVLLCSLSTKLVDCSSVMGNGPPSALAGFSREVSTYVLLATVLLGSELSSHSSSVMESVLVTKSSLSTISDRLTLCECQNQSHLQQLLSICIEQVQSDLESNVP